MSGHASGWIDVCASAELAEGGDGVRFDWTDASGKALVAFVVRHRGTVRAFVNRCPHRFAELDWLPGRFFDEAGLYLVCSMHGALFEADTGACVAGPCAGDRLDPLACQEYEDRVRVRRAPALSSTRSPGIAK
ncbi:MAG TPA: Rieske 2Fe-2S domain-containing protein [Zeimonas sp.]